MVEDPTYVPKIERFGVLFEDRVATAASLLAGDPEAIREIARARAVVASAIGELLGLYRDIYVQPNPAVGKDAVLRLTRLEANIAMSVAQTLDAMRKLIALRGAPRPLRAVRSKVLRRSIRTINASLARRDPAAPLSAVVGIKELMLAGRKPFKTALQVVGLVALHRPVSDWPRWLDPGNFVRADDITFTGFDEACRAMSDHPRRVMVLIGNHDTSLYDGSLANRAAAKLGTGHHIVMARKSVYPIPPPESPGDVVYVDEDDPNNYPVAASVARVKEFSAKHDAVSIAIYPEGMMPFNSAQMPLIAKDGAYIVARKIAIAMAADGLPVFLVEFKSNTLEHLTRTDLIAPETRVVSVETVPSEPMVKGQSDGWITRRRVQSQILYNEGRGERMIDVAASRRVPDSITFEAVPDLRNAEDKARN